MTSNETINRIQELFSGNVAIIPVNQPTTSSAAAATSASAVNVPTAPIRTFRSSAILNEISELDRVGRVSQLLHANRDIFERSLQRMVAANNPATSMPMHPAPVQETTIQRNNLQQQLPAYRNLGLDVSNNNNNNNISINAVQEMAREQIISEISELVHTQLVTNTLQNEDFRSSLERRGFFIMFKK